MLARVSLAASHSRGTSGIKEGEEDVMARGKLRDKGDREQEETG